MAFQYTKIKRFIRGRNFPLLKVITKSNNKDKSLIKARQLRQTAAVRNAGGGGAQRARHEWSLITPLPRHHQTSPDITTQFHFICHSRDPEIQGRASQWAIMGKLLAAGQWGCRQNGRILSCPGDKWTFCETVKAINVWSMEPKLIIGSAPPVTSLARATYSYENGDQMFKWEGMIEMIHWGPTPSNHRADKLTSPYSNINSCVNIRNFNWLNTRMEK